MITANNLISLDFEFNNFDEVFEFRDISVEFNELDSKEVVVKLNGFQLYGIQDHRDMSKLIELVYGI